MLVEVVTEVIMGDLMEDPAGTPVPHQDIFLETVTTRGQVLGTDHIDFLPS